MVVFTRTRASFFWVTLGPLRTTGRQSERQIIVDIESLLDEQRLWVRLLRCSFVHHVGLKQFLAFGLQLRLQLRREPSGVVGFSSGCRGWPLVVGSRVGVVCVSRPS